MSKTIVGLENLVIGKKYKKIYHCLGMTEEISPVLTLKWIRWENWNFIDNDCRQHVNLYFVDEEGRIQTSYAADCGVIPSHSSNTLVEV